MKRTRKSRKILFRRIEGMREKMIKTVGENILKTVEIRTKEEIEEEWILMMKMIRGKREGR